MSTTTEEKKVPTKAEVLNFYKEQIEVAKLRKELAQIVCETAEFDARRVEAIAKQAHFSAPAQQPQGMPEGVIPHTVTQEDLDNNPELAEQGIKVGDVVGISEKPQVEDPQVPASEEEDAETPVRKLKKE
jgi:hypothetical protein